MKNRTLWHAVLLMAWTVITPRSFSQEIVDQVVAVVGGNVIFQSDIENQYLQMRAQGYYSNLQGLKCEIFEELLIQKLFLNQAQVDSIVVDDSDVDSELDRRLKIFINQIGSEEKLEEYYKKSMYEIKSDFRDIIRDQMLTQKMQMQLSGDIKITPSEVRAYFRQLPADSIPEVPLQYELRQIVKKPKIDESEIFRVKEQLLSLRKRVLDGENFSTLAVLYSEDRGSAVRGGDLGYVSRNDLVKPFADAAFSLKQNQVSNIVESEYGYHIIQMVGRRNEQINVKHILIKPKSSPDAITRVEQQLDSLRARIMSDSLDFKRAAMYLSDDEDTRLNGGLMVNANAGNARFEMADLDRATLAAVRDLSEGQTSLPFRTVNESGQEVFKLIRMEKIYPAHKANLTDDYSLIQNAALNDKKLRIIEDWIREKQQNTYIRIDDSMRSCTYKTGTWFK